MIAKELGVAVFTVLDACSELPAAWKMCLVHFFGLATLRAQDRGAATQANRPFWRLLSERRSPLVCPSTRCNTGGALLSPPAPFHPASCREHRAAGRPPKRAAFSQRTEPED